MIKRIVFLLLLTQAAFAVAAQGDFASRLSDAAIALTRDDVMYDSQYFSIPYPNGDVQPIKVFARM